MKKTAATILAVLLPLAAMTEGTVTESRIALSDVVRISYSWTSSTNSWASFTTTNYVRGTIERVVFIPSTTAGSIPLEFDVTLKDAAGLDMLAGVASGIASNAASQMIPTLAVTDASTSATNVLRPFVVNDPLSLIVTNCGSVRSGAVVLYVR